MQLLNALFTDKYMNKYKKKKKNLLYLFIHLYILFTI